MAAPLAPSQRALLMRLSRRISLGHNGTAKFLQRQRPSPRQTVQPAVAAAEQLVLVVNAGSSSLKFKLFANAAAGLRAEVSGLVERIGDVHASRMVVRRVMGAWPNCQECTIDHAIQDHTQAMEFALQYLREEYSANLANDMLAVGHRVVHGRDMQGVRLADTETLQAISDASKLAPLHNPSNLQGITAASAMFSCPQVVAFDTAFPVSTMAPAAYTYALPPELAWQHGLRRYGFHGISYQYLVEASAEFLGIARPNLVIAHLGAGCSMAAVAQGRIIDTSMGFTPLEGLMMCTRCGDIDPAVVIYLVENCGMSPPDIDDLMNKQSGFKGMTGHTDLRAVTAAAVSGDATAQLAIEVFVHQVRKYLGAYLLELEGRTDAIVFSAGIGENSPLVRRLALHGLEAFGIQVDQAKNQAAVGGKAAADIHNDGSGIRVLVVPTDEELCIAEQTVALVEGLQGASCAASPDAL